jgi:hypothetical protein
MQEGASARFKRFFYLYQYVCLYVYLSVFLIRFFSINIHICLLDTIVCRSEKLLLIQFLFRLFPMFVSDWNIYSSVRFFYYSTINMIVFLLLCSLLFYLFSLLSVFSQIYFCIYVSLSIAFTDDKYPKAILLFHSRRRRRISRLIWLPGSNLVT